jgi:alpha-ketoglutarate-dependent 2,4-dichlorophenoxyacetate dioxygenase
MEVVPLGPGFAAELRGVTLADVAAYAAVRATFEEQSVLVFRGQQVTDELQLVFSRRFGPLVNNEAHLAGIDAARHNATCQPYKAD